MDTSTAEGRAGARPRLAELARASVAVLFGGRSSERSVSLVTGRALLAALRTPTDVDDGRGPREVLALEAREDGSHALEGQVLSPAGLLERLARVDLVFLGLHGGEGEGGTVQGFLATAGVPFTGSGLAASVLALDKLVARRIAAAEGLRVAPGREVRREDWAARRGECLAALRGLGPGWIVKPRCGGSSVGTAVAADEAALERALALAHAEEPSAVVETLLCGSELTGGVVEAPDGTLRALTPIEIRPHDGRFFDFEEKYSTQGATELCPPRSVSPAVCERLRALALRAHRMLGCAGYSRSDFFLPAGEEEPVFLELNTLPGFTPRSLLPLAAAHEGIDFRTLALWIAAEGLERGRGAARSA